MGLCVGNWVEGAPVILVGLREGVADGIEVEGEEEGVCVTGFCKGCWVGKKVVGLWDVGFRVGARVVGPAVAGLRVRVRGARVGTGEDGFGVVGWSDAGFPVDVDGLDERGFDVGC